MPVSRRMFHPRSVLETVGPGGRRHPEVPADRWEVDAYYDPDPSVPGKMRTRWGGFLDHIDLFDYEYFGIAPREAATMDPQHRLLLEVAWEALEDAGYPPNRIAGSRTGVWTAVYNSDYAQLQYRNLSSIDAHTSSGTAHSIAAGRISYLLDLRGPCMTVDTSCSSSLVAVHLACQNLRNQDCRMAMAGGASLVLTPEQTVSMSKWGMLAADGRCKTFDSRADGFVRGEGCGVVVLKRMSDALEDGDRIHALIRGSAVNHDGRSNALTAPNGLAQQDLLRKAFVNARISPITTLLCRGARHRHEGRRPHRGGSPERSRRAAAVGRKPLRPWFGQNEHRSFGSRCWDGRLD